MQRALRNSRNATHLMRSNSARYNPVMWGDDDIGSISKIRKKEKLKTKTNS